MVDLTSGDESPGKKQRKLMKRKTCEDDLDIEFQEDSISHGKRQRRGTTSQPNENSLEGALATWGRGDDDLEPSTKMLRMLELLKEWHSAGDKTIIYSQCMYPFDVMLPSLT